MSLRVTAVGRPLLAAVTEALAALHAAEVPMDAEWQMAFHKGKAANGGSFMEADYITLDASWAEQA